MQATVEPISMTDNLPIAGRKHTLSVFDAIAIIVGIVIGAGIFKTPSLVASNTGTESLMLLVWGLGGVVSLIGALCYVELATAYPHKGGEYHYLTRAFGRGLGFLFAWARLAVIQTGSIAMLAFVIGDYASQVFSLGVYTSSLYAAIAIAFLTAVNVIGFQHGKWTQNLLSGAIVIGLLSIVVGGIVLVAPAQVVANTQTAPAQTGTQAAFGMAMIFVLLTYGGWNEAAYLSTEVHDRRRNMVRVLLWGIGIITAIYVLANLAFYRGLGIEGMANSEVVAADLMRRVAGENGARFISLLIAIAALSTINATMFTGARTNYALGRDFPLFRFLGQWRETANTPANALLVQGAISLVLVLVGALSSRQGFTAMVEYTAPVFWFFFFMVGVALLVLRHKEPDIERPFRVPLYPLTPLLFCVACLYMLRSSVVYSIDVFRSSGQITELAPLLGIGVLLAGIPLLWVAHRRHDSAAAKSGSSE